MSQSPGRGASARRQPSDPTARTRSSGRSRSGGNSGGQSHGRGRPTSAPQRQVTAPVAPAAPAVPAAPLATSFAELGLADDLVAALAARGITAPFPIQALTLPDALARRFDAA